MCLSVFSTHRIAMRPLSSLRVLSRLPQPCLTVRRLHVGPSPSTCQSHRANLSSVSSFSLIRTYASKSKKPDKSAEKASARNKASLIPDREQGARGPRSTSADKLVPGSQQALVGEAQAEYERADAKMKASVDWYRRECAGLEMQGSGRVTPDVLKPVRVVLPDVEGESCGLNELGTVGVRDGTTIIVTVFSEDVSVLLLTLALVFPPSANNSCRP